LSVAIRRNSPQLQNINLDLVDWSALQEELRVEIDQDDDAERWFARRVLGLTSGPRKVTFAAIRKLSLSQVPLSAAMARAINFNTLVSLSLRKCPSWDTFLESVMELTSPIRLKTLELQYCDNVTQGLGYDVVEDFLVFFEGLEELFLGHPGPENTLELWNRVIHQQATLKMFVHHQRMVNLNDSSPYFEEELDLPDLGIILPLAEDLGGLSPEDREILLELEATRPMGQDPSNNPLASLSLDFIGLCCVPERLVSEILEIPENAACCSRCRAGICFATVYNEDFVKDSTHPSVSLRSCALLLLGREASLCRVRRWRGNGVRNKQPRD